MAGFGGFFYGEDWPHTQWFLSFKSNLTVFGLEHGSTSSISVLCWGTKIFSIGLLLLNLIA